MQKYFIGLFALFLPLVTANAALLCPGGSIAMPASTPTIQFEPFDQADETIVDHKTGLMWMRCPYGYNWDASTVACVNNQNIVTKTWTEALGIASTGYNYSGYSDWRLPNVKELASIVERKCQNLAINNEVFTGSPSGEYWTSTHVFTSTEYARTVSFSAGSVGSAKFTSQLYVRLVRDAN